jgi:hypothetical protein
MIQDKSQYMPDGLSLDEQKIWECLIFRDFLAFSASDWSIIQEDFVETNFYGISARNTLDKNKWCIGYPNLESYKEDWLKSSIILNGKKIEDDLFKVLMESSKLTKIQISDNVALVTKVFNGRCAVKNESDIIFDWTSFFTMRKLKSSWKIESFIGYIPN